MDCGVMRVICERWDYGMGRHLQKGKNTFILGDTRIMGVCDLL